MSEDENELNDKPKFIEEVPKISGNQSKFWAEHFKLKQKQKKRKNRFLILAINFLVFVLYAFYFITQKGELANGMMFGFFFIIHFLACILIGSIQQKPSWILSGFIILLIGFATCFSPFPKIH